MDRTTLPETVASAFKWACLSELEAIKPGNVHIFADGHGMVVEDFLQSADAAASAIGAAGLSVGERIFDAVDRTWDRVGCNTNLGIVLLCAPIAQAALAGSPGSLRDKLRDVLKQLSIDDAEAAFRAITKAAPAGLGESRHHDVHAQATVTLMGAMVEAQTRDRIAWQYCHDFADVFEVGLPRYQTLFEAWERPAWATSGVFLEFLARYPDTHILRKHGERVALQVQAEANEYCSILLEMDNPKLFQRNLLDFDASLKARGLNPGTCADLTVATLFAFALEKQATEKMVTGFTSS
jgi:triphosphoribosyl-dephospho-CoA synthase